MRIPIIAGNWKMNKTPSEAKLLAEAMKERLQAITGVDRVLCPPFVDIPVVASVITGSDIGLGAQNMYTKDSGAFTGEISPLMLKELCQYVILGHSERRRYFGETDDFVNEKVRVALDHGLTPIICIGETLEQNEAGQTDSVVSGQTRGVLTGLTKQEALKVVIAYEPIWAIGTGRAATADGAQRVIGEVIRGTLSDMFDRQTAQSIRIQYGGSMNPANTRELIEQPDIDGGLIGGASLKADDFVEIVRITAEVKGTRTST